LDPSKAPVAHLSYAVAREVIAIIPPTTTTASARSATSL
jgi:hypothetical protein